MKKSCSRNRYQILLAAGLLIAVAGCNQNNTVDHAANKQLVVMAKKDCGVFSDGIGFYVCTHGYAQKLFWTKSSKGKPKKDDIMTISTDSGIYAYGMDFSTTMGVTGGLSVAFPAPPLLAGYGFGYVGDGSKSLNRYWAADFLPVKGYEAEVYKIIFRGPVGSLKDGNLEYQYMAFLLPGNKAYYFKYDSEKKRQQEKLLREKVSSALSNAGRTYAGVLISKALIFDEKRLPFKIRFLTFDQNTGEVVAEASGIGEAEVIVFKGKLLDYDHLKLATEDGNVQWDLELTDNRVFSGFYGTQDGLTSKRVVITLLDSAKS
ncbi:MAG TPA: hypothetical protein ENI80_10585 [Acidiferrobacteraceae bacterium]|nr:hypothetical protein [Acidiferrobacteraceae bacterium]